MNLMYIVFGFFVMSLRIFCVFFGVILFFIGVFVLNDESLGFMELMLNDM